MLIDDRLDCSGGSPGCPEADRLRETGVRFLRHYFSVANMVDAAWNRNPHSMLESLREGRKLYLEYFPDTDPSDSLMSEFAVTEARLINLVEAANKRLA